MVVIIVAKKVEKKEKLAPKKCVCGKDAVTVKQGNKKMVSCPDPLNCIGNLRTNWRKSYDEAIIEWNNQVGAFRFTSRREAG